MLGFCRQADGGVKLVVAKGGAVWWVLRFARACRVGRRGLGGSRGQEALAPFQVRVGRHSRGKGIAKERTNCKSGEEKEKGLDLELESVSVCGGVALGL